MFPKSVLQAASQLEIRSRLHIASLLAGDYRSSFRGSGMQFKEFRPYEPGDDIRHINWQVTARTGKPTVKIYEEERELNVVAVVDASGSTAVGTSRPKFSMYAEITALLGLGAVRAGDPFGLALFSNRMLAHLPARRSAEHVRQAMESVNESARQGQRSDIRPVLGHLRRALKNRSLVVILSDFALPAFDVELRTLATRHEIVLLQGLDACEQGQRISGVYRTRDPETGAFGLLDAGSKPARAQLGAQQTELEERLKDLGRGTGADFLRVRTNEDYLGALVRFFHQRSRRA